jgi:hypothetical protein
VEVGPKVYGSVVKCTEEQLLQEISRGSSVVCIAKLNAILDLVTSNMACRLWTKGKHWYCELVYKVEGLMPV